MGNYFSFFSSFFFPSERLQKKKTEFADQTINQIFLQEKKKKNGGK